MIQRKLRSVKNEKISLSGRTAQTKCLICQRKDLCKSFTMLSFTLSLEALNLSKRDMQKQNRSN